MDANNTGSLHIAEARRPGSIDEAMKVLDQALGSQDTAPKFGELVSNDLRVAKESFAHSPAVNKTKSRMSDAAHSASVMGSMVAARSKDMYEQVSDLSRVGYQQAAVQFREVDRRVHQNPWPFIGGVAVGTFALGYLLSRRNAATRVEADVRIPVTTLDYPVAPAFPEETIV